MDTANEKIINDFLVFLIENAAEFVSVEQIKKVTGDMPSRQGLLGMGDRKAPASLLTLEEPALKQKVADIITLMSSGFGIELSEKHLEDIYSRLEKKYSPKLSSDAVMPLIPENFLEKYRIQFLSKEELEARVLEKTKELQQFNADLEKKVAERTEELRKLLEEQRQKDIELTKANEELKILDQRKSEFLSVVAHQMRTPLSGIKWTLDMLIKGQIEPVSNDQKAFLMKAYESNERMIKLIDEMLHADRIESGRFELTRTPTQVLDLIDNVLYELSPEAAKKNITITFNKGTGELPLLNIDQEKIREVFQNIIENAIKYSKPGGAVSLDISRQDGKIVYAVKDAGIGIPPDQQSQIFSRFFRARNAIKTEADGNGLGLYIVKSILELHGGKIWFETKENEGTTFYFSLKI